MDRPVSEKIQKENLLIKSSCTLRSLSDTQTTFDSIHKSNFHSTITLKYNSGCKSSYTKLRAVRDNANITYLTLKYHCENKPSSSNQHKLEILPKKRLSVIVQSAHTTQLSPTLIFHSDTMKPTHTTMQLQ